ncbi:MAG: MBL fold metallo-hydrolase [Cyanobacteriota bacterium]|nr:MBL fold metallo-hydrolase [Cyanobacteriota bacterium]
MIFRQFFDRESGTYTYLLGDPVSKEALLVDPVLAQVDRDQQWIRELGLTLRFCLETHVHADHVTGTGQLRAVTGCQGVVPMGANVTCADRFIGHGDVLSLGSVEIEAISTLGHTDSHMSYRVDKQAVLTGDALLIRGCGRTDFQSGDAGLLYDHVTNRLFNLPDHTLVYPGHDYKGQTVSTIGEEKRWNPRFIDLANGQLRSRSEFIALMANLHLPNPQKIQEALPANEQCGQVSLAR